MSFPSTTEFVREPLDIVDGIPVFSTIDRYVDNYARIASDHLASMRPGVDNPFIENALWLQLERSTRTFVEKYVADGARVLDVGVGLGRVLAPLHQYQRYGIDISHPYLKLARAQGFAAAFARVEDMPYVDGLFDAVVICDVLEHVLDLHACTIQILRVLKPGGHLIVRVPYREDLEVYLKDDLPYEFIHLRNFDEHSLRLHFQKIYGCRVVEFETVAPYWQGATRLRHRPFTLGDPLRGFLADEAARLPALDAQGLGLLKAITATTEEELVAWINRIKQESPALFDVMMPHLLLGIEINMVVQKQ